mmetsp:Transcript_9254/g.16324  ORF Transcript_9254/g.16324 Transcript_9254/m.16324 type:complete len:262 (+) Transcript_9254:1174-1959(+)
MGHLLLQHSVGIVLLFNQTRKRIVVTNLTLPRPDRGTHFDLLKAVNCLRNNTETSFVEHAGHGLVRGHRHCTISCDEFRKGFLTNPITLLHRSHNFVFSLYLGFAVIENEELTNIFAFCANGLAAEEGELFQSSCKHVDVCLVSDFLDAWNLEQHLRVRSNPGCEIETAHYLEVASHEQPDITAVVCSDCGLVRAVVEQCQLSEGVARQQLLILAGRAMHLELTMLNDEKAFALVSILHQGLTCFNVNQIHRLTDQRQLLW